LGDRGALRVCCATAPAKYDSARLKMRNVASLGESKSYEREA